MNMKRARFWRNLLLFSALSGAASLPQTHAQEGVSRVGDGSAGPGSAGVPTPEGFAPLSPSPYMPLDPGYNFPRPMPPGLPPASDSLRNSRRDSFGPRFDIGQFLGDRLGVNDNDTNFNFLLPYLMGSENDVIFIDGRGVATSLGKGAASAGIGFRSYDPTFNRLFGISGWVDYDQGHARTYQQAGISFESLGTWMDLRVNGYIPFGRESNLVGSSTVGDPFFSGSGLFVNQRQLTESAYRGLDAEIGGPLPLLGRYGVSGYVGGYWLDSKADAVAAGPRVRLEANVTDNMRVSMIASDDPVFGTNAWVNLNLTLPDGRPRRWFRPTEVQDRLLRTVERSYRVQTHTRADLVPTPVFVPVPGTPNNPQGGFPGQPVRVIFVDPDRLTNGDGTLENPFNTFQGFANVAANTLIIVDGSPIDRPVTGTVSLFADQKLLSTSILAAGGVQLDTNLGVITLPSIPGFGDAIPVSPILQNPAGGTLVTLGGNNIEVAGMTFDGSTSNIAIPNATGIAGSNFLDFNIHHNTFRDYSNAVVMSNARGVGLFQANTLTGTPGVSVDGFRLTNSGVGSLDLFINSFEPPATGAGSSLVASANTFTGNDNAGINITARNRAVINAHIVDNTISNNGQGIILDAAATRSVINAAIVNNTIDGNRGEDRNLNGILDPGEDLNGDGVLNPGNGVLLMANASTLNLAQLGEDVNSNGVLDPSEDTNGNGVFDLSEDTNGNGVLDVSEDKNGNGILDAGEDTNGDGLLDTITEDTNGNGILDAGEDTNGDGLITTRLTEDTNGNGKLDLSEDKNGNGKLDASEDTNGNGRLDGGYFLGNNTITRNTGDGVAVQSLNNSIVNLFVVANNFGSPTDHSTGNRGRGLSITADSGTVNANIGFLPNEDKNFNGVLDLSEDTNGNGILDAGEDVNGNGSLDLSEDTNGNGIFDGGDPLDANHFVANRAGGLFVDLSGTAVGNIVAINNTITGVGSGGLTFQIAGLNNGTATGNPFSFVNSSLQGNNVAGLVWNLAPAALEFNTTGVNSTLFTPANATETSTGLTTVNGTTNPIQVTDQATALNLQFASFQSLNGVLDTGEDTNANGILDPGEDLPGHFDFTAGTSVAGDTLASVAGNQFIGSQVTATFSSGQVLTGTMQAVTGSLTDSEFVVNANGNNAGTGPGVEMRVSQTAVLNNPTFVSNNIQFNGGAGFTAQATEDGQINNLLLRGNTIQNNGTTANGGGINLRTVAASSAQINGSILDNNVQNNSGPGIFATADSGTIELLQINNNTLTGNTNAVSLNTLNGGAITTRVTNNSMDGSTGDGFIANADTGTITLNQFTANTLTNSGGNGILFNATNGGTITIPPTEDLNGNLILDAGEDLNGNGFLDLGMFLNDVSGSAGNGLFITGTGGNFNLGRISGLTSNRGTTGQGGIVINVTDSVLTGQFVGNTLLGSPTEDTNGNGVFDVSEDADGDGILDTGEDTNGNGVLDTTTEDRNGDGLFDLGNTNAGPGFSLTATNGTFDISIGGPNEGDGNVIRNNRGAGIAILAQNTAVGTFRILNNEITGTTNDGATTPFAGEGIYVGTRSVDSLSPAIATLFDSTIEGNLIGGSIQAAGNISHGIGFEILSESTLRNLTIRGNRIGNNGADGINFRRRDNALIENVLISGNGISSNGDDGIGITASDGGRTLLGFNVEQNDISLNGSNGLNLRVEGDARLNINIFRNLIDSNGTANTLNAMNGIITTENFNDPTDSREIGGNWLANRITNNPGYGIQFNSTATNIFNETLAGSEVKRDVPPDGTADLTRFGVMPELVIGGSLIDSNGLDGIEFNGPGKMTIDSNTITNNGLNALLPAFNPQLGAFALLDDNGNGIDIQSVMRDLAVGVVVSQLTVPQAASEPQASSPKVVNVLRNLIQNNRNDGLEIRHANNPSVLHDAPLHPGYYPLSVTVRENTIENNGGRGVDILNQGGNRSPEFEDLDPLTGATIQNQFSPTDTTVRLLDNRIASNGKEGVYVVNTSSLTQGQTGPTPVPATPDSASRGMNTDGPIAAVPRLVLEVHNNVIVKNGQFLDVNTSIPGIQGTLTGSGLVIRVGTSDNESILNFTADYASGATAQDLPLPVIDANGFFRRSQPGGVIAKITNNTFEGNFGSDVYIESFQSSGGGATRPVLARLDMIFENNSGDSLDVTNFGAFFNNPRANAQRNSSLLALPGGLTEVFGRVVGVHRTQVEGGPGQNDTPTLVAFDGIDTTDGTSGSNLDDRGGIYDGHELEFLSRSGTTDASRIVSTYTGLPPSRFSLNNPQLSAVPALGESVQVELSQKNIFDVLLFSSNPETNLNAQPISFTTNFFAGQNAILRFIDETNVNNEFEPVRDQQAILFDNWQLVNGQQLGGAQGNPNKFHVDLSTGAVIDNIGAVGQGEGPIQSDPTGVLAGRTSNQTLRISPTLSLAPRDENLFVISAIQQGRGDPTFRMSGAAVANGAGVNTNQFNNENLGFDAKVSLESTGPDLTDELPFEWGALPDANRSRVLEFFPGLTPLPTAPPSYRNFTYPRIVFP